MSQYVPGDLVRYKLGSAIDVVAEVLDFRTDDVWAVRIKFNFRDEDYRWWVSTKSLEVLYVH